MQIYVKQVLIPGQQKCVSAGCVAETGGDNFPFERHSKIMHYDVLK